MWSGRYPLLLSYFLRWISCQSWYCTPNHVSDGWKHFLSRSFVTSCFGTPWRALEPARSTSVRENRQIFQTTALGTYFWKKGISAHHREQSIATLTMVMAWLNRIDVVKVIINTRRSQIFDQNFHAILIHMAALFSEKKLAEGPLRKAILSPQKAWRSDCVLLPFYVVAAVHLHNCCVPHV